MDADKSVKYIQELEAIMLFCEEKGLCTDMMHLAIYAAQDAIAGGWILCKTKRPNAEENKPYLVTYTISFKDVIRKYVSIAHYNGGTWRSEDGSVNVIAWMPLPEPCESDN